MASKKFPMIASVYSGRPGCACGCRGTHTENPSSVTRVVRTLESNAADVRVIKGLGGELIFCLDTETRAYAVYCKAAS